MTTFLVHEDENNNLSAEEVGKVLESIDPATDAVVTDRGIIVHNPELEATGIDVVQEVET